MKCSLMRHECKRFELVESKSDIHNEKAVTSKNLIKCCYGLNKMFHIGVKKKENKKKIALKENAYLQRFDRVILHFCF